VTDPEPSLLDLSQFASLEDAHEKIAPQQRYMNLGVSLGAVDTIGTTVTQQTLFWQSMITRSEGLHGAIAREIHEQNPHAAFPLLRAFAEDVALVIYVHDHPSYVRTLTQRQREIPAGEQKRKTVKALIDYAATHAPGMAGVYAELSEVSHFGAVAMWASYTVDGDNRTTWSSGPRFRSEQQALIACAQTLELAGAMVHHLRRFAIRHVLPLWESTRSPSEDPAAGTT
jgi:hypothetical protein